MSNVRRWLMLTGLSVMGAGRQASHDLYIDIEGLLKDGKRASRRTVVSDPSGNAHLTALGVLVSIERVLGLDGRPAAGGGLHLPETLVEPDEALARFKQFGVQVWMSWVLLLVHME